MDALANMLLAGAGAGVKSEPVACDGEDVPNMFC